MADKRRRKSLSLFKPRSSQTFDDPPIVNSLLEKSPDVDYIPSPVESDHTSPKIRPRTLQKANRTSVFGSLRSLHSLDEDEKVALTRSDSKASSLHEDGEWSQKWHLGATVVQYGDIQTVGSNMFRKKTLFLVLTESHLIRFRSQNKAAEMFAIIPSVPNRSTSSRLSMNSSGSYQELHMLTYSDIVSGVPLEQVVAVYKLDDGRPFFTIEVSFLDERSKTSGSLQLLFQEPQHAETWVSSIRSAITRLRSVTSVAVPAKTLEYVARVLERDRDYDPNHFAVFKVVQRVASRTGSRTSMEDLSKVNSNICYLAIGVHRLYLIPPAKSSNRSSVTSLNELDTTISFGIATLTEIHLPTGEDSFQVVFRSPLRKPHVLQLASSTGVEIVTQLRFAAEFLRPQWLRQPFIFDIPKEIDDELTTPDFPVEDYNSFDRTLIAYCAAYEVDTSRICYSVDHNCEDSPFFQLLPPIRPPSYSALELLAVFRALRYNEYFTSISMSNIDLTALRQLYDPYGMDVDSASTRSGAGTGLLAQQELSILGHEVRALALKSRRLRRLDFSYTLHLHFLGEGEKNSSGIPEALVPLCKKSLTNVDWIVLRGIQLNDSDLNFLVDAASERICHLRALEIGECGLSVHDVNVLLTALSAHENTMEVIDISGAQGRFSPELFQQEIAVFSHIRRLNLTRVQRTAGPESLIAPETLLAWRLESLDLSRTNINEQTVDSLSAYLASDKSDILREIHLNQCGLTGRDLAIFFRSMTPQPGISREMHISASENRLKAGGSHLFEAIGQSYGPSSLTMRMMDFEKEIHFRELIVALTANKTIRSLDISRASLPHDAGPETSEALKEMFAINTTLEELDISGEQAHLDATRFGIGLNIALRGLSRNKSLRLLRIEHQGLGLQGANTLADVLQTNNTLTEIHCEHNDINLQSFTILVNALEYNTSLVYMPTLSADRARSIEVVRREVGGIGRPNTPDSLRVPPSPRQGGSIKRTFGGSLGANARRRTHRPNNSISSATSYTEQDIEAAIAALDEKWSIQISRMQQYLHRNQCLAQGVAWSDNATVDSQRPGTMESISKMLDRVKLDRTPTGAQGMGLDYMDQKLEDHHPMVFHLPDDET